jgi:hypothetical protein
MPQSCDLHRVVGTRSRDSSLSLFTVVKMKPSHVTEGLGMTLRKHRIQKIKVIMG